MAIKHNFHTARPDGPDDGSVQPQHWNEDHVVEGILAAFLEVALSTSSIPYVKADGGGATSPLTDFARVLLALTTSASFRNEIGAVAISGDTMTGALNMGNHKITGLATPTVGTDAVTKAYADAIVTTVSGALIFRGAWDASAGIFPGGGTAQTGAFYKVSVAGTVGGKAFEVGDDIFAIADNASTTVYANNWLKIEGGISLAEVQAAVGFTFGSLASASSVTAAQISDATADGRSLIKAANYAAMRGLLGLGSAALLTAGTGANNAVQLDGTGKMPAVDGSALTNITASAAGVLLGINFYSSSQTITIPTGATKALVKLWGGSGGSAGANSAPASSGGGAGGAYLEKFLTGLTAALTLALTIGAAGAAGTATPTNGTAGGNSSLASGTQTIATLTANGGAPSLISAQTAQALGGTASGGDINVKGQNGQPPAINTTDAIFSAGHGGVTGGGMSVGGAGVIGSNAGNPGAVGGCIVFWFK